MGQGEYINFLLFAFRDDLTWLVGCGFNAA